MQLENGILVLWRASRTCQDDWRGRGRRRDSDQQLAPIGAERPDYSPLGCLLLLLLCHLGRQVMMNWYQRSKSQNFQATNDYRRRLSPPIQKVGPERARLAFFSPRRAQGGYHCSSR